MPTPLVAKPPQGLLRWALRLPILLYRLRLGWLLGERLLLLNHIGRTSGQARQTVVEVVDYDMASDTYFIASGWGYKAHWYQNLMATPAITIQVGRRRLAVRAETIAPDTSVQILLKYRQKHPLAARELSRLIGLDINQSAPEQLEKVIRESLPVVALRPVPPKEPPQSA